MKSSKPRKQRKLIYKAPQHVRRKLLSAHFSLELREKYKRRAFPIRKGDVVRVVRGDHAGTEGKVARVDYKKCRIYLEGLKRERVDGTAVLTPIHPSNVMITKLNLDDKLRKASLKK
jgi:large subunit ribosomal protein L24